MHRPRENSPLADFWQYQHLASNLHRPNRQIKRWNARWLLQCIKLPDKHIRLHVVPFTLLHSLIYLREVTLNEYKENLG